MVSFCKVKKTDSNIRKMQRSLSEIGILENYVPATKTRAAQATQQDTQLLTESLIRKIDEL